MDYYYLIVMRLAGVPIQVMGTRHFGIKIKQNSLLHLLCKTQPLLGHQSDWRLPTFNKKTSLNALPCVSASSNRLWMLMDVDDFTFVDFEATIRDQDFYKNVDVPS